SALLALHITAMLSPPVTARRPAGVVGGAAIAADVQLAAPTRAHIRPSGPNAFVLNRLAIRASGRIRRSIRSHPPVAQIAALIGERIPFMGRALLNRPAAASSRRPTPRARGARYVAITRVSPPRV